MQESKQEVTKVVSLVRKWQKITIHPFPLCDIWVFQQFTSLDHWIHLIGGFLLKLLLLGIWQASSRTNTQIYWRQTFHLLPSNQINNAGECCIFDSNVKFDWMEMWFDETSFNWLTLGMLGTADDILKFFFFLFSQKTSFDISCKLETICMKCQSLFSDKNKILFFFFLLNIIYLLSAEFAQGVLKDN